jgi:hypothetical protein
MKAGAIAWRKVARVAAATNFSRHADDELGGMLDPRRTIGTVR